MSKQRRLTAARLMRNQFRSSFRATARPHGQLRSLSNCCSCMCESVSVRGLTCEEPETERPPLSQKAYCHPTVLSVCVLCLDTELWRLSSSSLQPPPPPLPSPFPSPPRCFGLGRGPPPAGTAVKVHRHRVLRPDQGGVPFPASPVSQVRV